MDNFYKFGLDANPNIEGFKIKTRVGVSVFYIGGKKPGAELKEGEEILIPTPTGGYWKLKTGKSDGKWYARSKKLGAALEFDETEKEWTCTCVWPNSLAD